MGLLDGFERLINEHGSASILKERIALANDKYAILESENAVLRAENEALRLDNGKLQEQWRALNKQLSETHNNPLKFDENTGTWVGDGSNTRYCAKCKASNTLSPMKNDTHGWSCSVCSMFFNDPDRPNPRSSRRTGSAMSA